MSKIYIFGHRSPDTDSATAAVIAKDLMESLTENEYEAVVLGDINKETEFAFNSAGMEMPKCVKNIEPASEVILVDHNEFSQSIENITELEIIQVIDHHRIKDFETASPLYYRAEPVGCTSTILYSMYIENKIEIKKNIAKLMLSAIISDTLLLKSPTCTKRDVEAAKALSEYTNTNLEEYGISLLKAGTDLSGYTDLQLLELDAKETMLKDIKAIVAQVNTADISEVMCRKSGIIEAMKQKIEENNLGIIFLAITDVINNNSQVIAIGEKASIVEKAYNKSLEDDTMFLEGVVSRKKQMIPVLTENA